MKKLVNSIVSGEFCLIAEIGVNYYDIAAQRGCSLMDAAKLMCVEALNAGVSAVKFQTYRAETLAAKVSPSYWDTSEEPTLSQFDLFKKFDSFREADYIELSEFCARIGVGFCSTAFDFESADYLDPLMDVFKISSSDLTNIPFIEYQAAKGKMVALSVGAGDLQEIVAAVAAIRRVNSQPMVLMHCVLEYPTPYGDANLRRISTLKSEFPDAIIGYSDHTRPDAFGDVIKTAFSLGATVVEKHFTLDKTLSGNDHYHSMDPEDAKRLVSGVGFVAELLGNAELVHTSGEDVSRLNARRSLVSTRRIHLGEVVTPDCVTFKRPGTGIPPSQLHSVVGAVAVRDIDEDTVLQGEMFRSAAI